MLLRILKQLLVGLAIAALSGSSALADCPHQRPNGYCPETTPRPGEVPIWQSQFKSLNGSWDIVDDHSVMDQIDDYNNWMVEFDVYYYAGNITVNRFDCDFGGEWNNLYTAAGQTYYASTSKQRVTFMFMKPGDGGSDTWYYCFGNFAAFGPTQGYPPIKDTLLQVIPEDQFYTHADFRDIDNFTWPSAQELIRRGQYFVAIVDEFSQYAFGDPFGGVDENFFFGAFSGDPDWNNPGNRVLAQRNGGCDGGGTPSAWTPNPRFLMRGYPAGACSGSCLLQDGGYWDDGVNQGFTFISTDCIDNDLCVDARIQSPMPYFVANSGTYDHNWGTLAFPRVGTTGLFNATQRVSPMVDIRIAPGTYTLTDVPQFIINQKKITRPMVLKNNTGAGDVVIR